MTVWRTGLYLLLVWSAGCTAPPGAREGDSAPPAAAVTPASAASLRFAGQPDAAELARLRAEGVEIVIDLREPDETDFDQSAAAAGAGLDYYTVPVSDSGPGFDPAAVASITDIVEANSGSGILVYCSSGNRASAWYAIYLVEHQGLDIETALARARGQGLTRPELEVRIRDYLGGSR